MNRCPTCNSDEKKVRVVLKGKFTRRSGEVADTWTCPDAWHGDDNG